jgi:histidinol-phosphate aminotransferase
MRGCLDDVRLYPDNDCYRLRHDLASHLGVGPEQVVVGRGSDEVIHMLGLAFLCPGDEVIMSEPPFTLYDFTANVMDGVAIRVPMKDFREDLDAMAARITERTKLIFLANPNNPTGSYLSRDEIDAFMGRVPDRVIVAFDEAYFEYVDAADYPASLDYLRKGRNVVILRTFSKIYALAGLRIGYGIGSAEMIGYLNQVREPFNISTIAQTAASASLQDAEQVARSCRCNVEGRKFLYDAFTRLGLPYVPTQANFILVDVRRECRQVFVELLKRGVIVRTGDIFGLPTHVRVTIGLPAENERFISALEAVLQA